MAVELGRLVTVLGQAPMGDSRPVRGMVVTSNRTVEAWVKRVPDIERLHVEAICSLLGRSLGLPVPEPLYVFFGAEFGGPGIGFGSSAIGYPNMVHWIDCNAEIVRRRLKSWPKLVDAACFDEWIANCDRHFGNLIHDGTDGFWLIDHDKAIHPSIILDKLAPINQLFDYVIDGADEERLLSLQQTVGVAMHEMHGLPLQSVMEGVRCDALSASSVQPINDWLEARQAHLVRFGNDRIPAKQAGVV